jgi:hypothetical protein
MPQKFPEFYGNRQFITRFTTAHMEQQFVVTHTVHQSEASAKLDCRVANTPSAKMLCPQKNSFPYISVKI